MESYRKNSVGKAGPAGATCRRMGLWGGLLGCWLTMVLSAQAAAPSSQPASAPAGVGSRARLSTGAFRIAQTKSALVREACDGAKLWQDFLSRWPESEQAPAAREQLRLWQGRVDDKSRLIGKEWWPEAKLLEALAATRSDLIQARSALVQLTAKPDDSAANAARLALRAALDKLPHHRDAYFFRGLLNLETRQYPAAAGDFQKTAELDPTFWPGWVNRAVVLVRGRNFPAGVLACQQAAAVGPTDGPYADLILDNYEEALHLLEPLATKLTSMQLARKDFDGRLNARVVQEQRKDRMRWGSTWISRQEYQEIQDRIAWVDSMLEGPQARRTLARQRLAEAKDQFQQNSREAEAIENLLRHAGPGTVIPATTLARRSRLAEQKNDLLQDMREANESLALADREIAELEKKRPRPPYKQTLLAVDASILDVMPPPFGLLPDLRPPASQPATQPASLPSWLVDSPLPPR